MTSTAVQIRPDAPVGEPEGDDGLCHIVCCNDNRLGLCGAVFDDVAIRGEVGESDLCQACVLADEMDPDYCPVQDRCNGVGDEVEDDGGDANA